MTGCRIGLALAMVGLLIGLVVWSPWRGRGADRPRFVREAGPVPETRPARSSVDASFDPDGYRVRIEQLKRAAVAEDWEAYEELAARLEVASPEAERIL